MKTYFFQKPFTSLCALWGILKIVILNPLKKQMLYFNGNDKILRCHSERSEESRKMFFKPLSSGFFTSFRMTDKCKDDIGNRSEESHKSLIPQVLRFFTSFRMTREIEFFKLHFIKVFLLIILLSTINLYSQDKETINQIIGSAYTESQAYDFLQRLCDEAGGRLAGSPENEKGISILNEELNKIGIQAKLEKFTMNSWKRADDNVEIITPIKKKLRVYALGYSPKTPEFTSELVFLNCGTDEDFKTIDSKDKICLITLETPKGAEQQFRCEVVERSANSGAKAVLFINTKNGGLNLCGTSNFSGKEAKIPAFSITYEEGSSLRRLLKKDIPVNIKIQVNSQCFNTETSNIIVTFPGISPKKIVVGAHFDSWDVSQGAVDNGHGTAMLFDIARLINKYSLKNYYTIELVWFNAEELGLFGSKEYAERHSEEIIAMINMDMTGTPTGFNTMGYEEFIPFFENLKDNFKGFSFKDGITTNPWVNSDHTPFMLKGIPSFTFSCFLEKDMYHYYHDFGDTFDKVDTRILADASAIVTVMTLKLANYKDFNFKKYSETETIELFKKYNLDKRLKRQKDWDFKE